MYNLDDLKFAICIKQEDWDRLNNGGTYRSSDGMETQVKEFFNSKGFQYETPFVCLGCFYNDIVYPNNKLTFGDIVVYLDNSIISGIE